jgi:hypothetical protein
MLQMAGALVDPKAGVNTRVGLGSSGGDATLQSVAVHFIYARYAVADAACSAPAPNLDFGKYYTTTKYIKLHSFQPQTKYHG